VDASKRATGGVLFQLHDTSADTQASPDHQQVERIIMFISFKLLDAESRYTNSEWKALAVVRTLAEVRWLITASPHATMVYTDHEALTALLVGVDNDAYGLAQRVTQQTWMGLLFSCYELAERDHHLYNILLLLSLHSSLRFQ
jgi:hypothetical protein